MKWVRVSARARTGARVSVRIRVRVRVRSRVRRRWCVASAGEIGLESGSGLVLGLGLDNGGVCSDCRRIRVRSG